MKIICSATTAIISILTGFTATMIGISSSIKMPINITTSTYTTATTIFLIIVKIIIFSIVLIVLTFATTFVKPISWIAPETE